MKKILLLLAVLVIGVNVAMFTVNLQQKEAVAEVTSQEVNVYSSRKTYLIKDVLDIFTERTGIKVNLITDSAPKLVARLVQEGALTPADIFITTDIGNLVHAKEQGVLKSVESDVLRAAIPAYLRDPDNIWYGLTIRTRALFYARDRVNPEQLSTYEALANPEWNNKILVRSSSNIYNQSLIASLIDEHGVAQTEEWAKGLVANFARHPQGGDTDQMRAVAAGEGDVAIANSYYYGRLLASDKPEDQAVVEKVAIFFPNQAGRGAHINISGAAVTKHAKHTQAAIALLEFLVSDEAQELFAAQNHEAPVVPGVELSDVVASWGGYKRDNRPLANVAHYYVDAIKLADRVGWK